MRRITRVGEDVHFLPRRVYPYMGSSRRDEQVRLCNRNVRLGHTPLPGPSKLRSNYITQWSSPLHDEPELAQLVKNFLAIYETFTLITVLTRARIGPYPKPDKPGPQFLIYLLQICFNNILPPTKESG
jgi:hypothetical protein